MKALVGLLVAAVLALPGPAPQAVAVDRDVQVGSLTLGNVRRAARALCGSIRGSGSAAPGGHASASGSC